jgi:RecJ-like exonuclease
MALIACRLCGKLFPSSAKKICPACLTRIDELYPRVREFLRDHPKIEFNVETVAEAIEADIRDVQALVDMNYLERDLEHTSSTSSAAREKLAEELQNSLQQMKTQAAKREAAKDAASSYGQQRYGGNKVKP